MTIWQSMTQKKAHLKRLRSHWSKLFGKLVKSKYYSENNFISLKLVSKAKRDKERNSI